MAPVEGFAVVDTRNLLKGRAVRVEEIRLRGPDGSLFSREVMRHPGSVAVLPYDGERVVLIRQLRAAVGGPLLEIPAGTLDAAGERPEEAAIRECEEEVGYRPERLTLLATFYNSPGYTDELTRLYLAEDLAAVPARPAGAEERAAEIVHLPFAEALRRAGRGDLRDGKTVLALALAAPRLGR